MKMTRLSLALLAALPAAAFAAQPHQGSPAAGLSFSRAAAFTVSPMSSSGSVVVTFSGLELEGYQFADLTTDLGPFEGVLTSVSINATLDASVDYSWAQDLTIYISPILDFGGNFQAGGTDDLGAAELHFWANGDSSAPGTTVIDSYTLLSPLTFTGTPSDSFIYLGNGWGGAGVVNPVGTWSGSVTLNFASAVPEPSTWALFAAGGAGLLGWAGRRRRSLDKAA
jgi:hypothetical protein